MRVCVGGVFLLVITFWNSINVSILSKFKNDFVVKIHTNIKIHIL